MKRQTLSDTLRTFISRCVPTYEAAELLVLLSGQPDRDFSVEEILLTNQVMETRPGSLRRHLALFAACGLATEQRGRWHYSPASDDLAAAVSELLRAYRERPVTLIAAFSRNGGDEHRR